MRSAQLKRKPCLTERKERETRERHGGCALEMVGDTGGCGCSGLEVPLQIVGSSLSTKF